MVLLHKSWNVGGVVWQIKTAIMAGVMLVCGSVFPVCGACDFLQKEQCCATAGAWLFSRVDLWPFFVYLNKLQIMRDRGVVMLNGSIDLHLHTNCSDGVDTPEELVATAVENGFNTIAITDHDTVTGVEPAIRAAEGTGLEIIPGIELSAIDGDDDIHILGYFVDYEDPDFLDRIKFFMEKRYERAEKIVESLNYLGLDISLDAVLKVAHGAPIGRPHIAAALLSEKLISYYNEAFTRYIGYKGPAYVPKYNISPKEAIELLICYGGIPVLAHPMAVNRDEMIPGLIDCGLMGIEAVHPLHTPEKQEHYRNLAREYGLIITGGSDWHGHMRRQRYQNIVDSSVVSPETIAEMRLIRQSDSFRETSARLKEAR